MKHLFVPYPIAVMAKDAGFNEDCIAYWYDGILGQQGDRPDFDKVNNKENLRGDCAAPLYQQVIDWFRDKHEIIFLTVPHGSNPVKFSFIIPKCYTPNKEGWIPKHVPLEYYAALGVAIEQAFTLINDKKK